MTSSCESGSVPNSAAAEMIEVRDCIEILGGNESRTELRTVAGIEVLLVARPAGAPSGGDIYCLHSCGHGTLAKFVLLDLTGHGRERDLIARTVHELLHQYSTETSPAQLLEMLNRTYDRLGLRAILASVVGATFDPSLGLFRFSNAGQPRPLRWSARRHQWAFLMPVQESDCGLPLGVTAAACYEEETVSLSPGDTLFWFSDGLPETRNAAEEFLEPEGVLQLAQDCTDEIGAASPLATLGHAFLRRLEQFRGGMDFQDAVTLLWARRLPVERAAGASAEPG